MDDQDTDSIELTRPEARKVVSALSDFEVGQSGSEEREAQNIRKHLAAEFNFERKSDEKDTGLINELTDDLTITDDAGPRSVELSKSEAKDVIAALSDFETQQSGTGEKEPTEDIQERFEEKFELRDR
jgi:hypothetical protein